MPSSPLPLSIPVIIFMSMLPSPIHISCLNISLVQYSTCQQILMFLGSLNGEYDHAVSHVHQILDTWNEDTKLPNHISLDELPTTLNQYMQDLFNHHPTICVTCSFDNHKECEPKDKTTSTRKSIDIICDACDQNGYTQSHCNFCAHHLNIQQYL